MNAQRDMPVWAHAFSLCLYERQSLSLSQHPKSKSGKEIMASNAACSRRWRVGYNSVLIRTSCWIQTVIRSYHPKYAAVATFISPFLASQSVSDIPHWSYSRLCVKVPIKSHTSLSPAIVPRLLIRIFIFRLILMPTEQGQQKSLHF